MGYSPWGCKELDMTERLSTAQHTQAFNVWQAPCNFLFEQLRFSLMGPYPLLFPCSGNNSAMQDTACNARDTGSIPGSGRSPGRGKGNPLQCSCLGNPMDRGAWQATVHGVTRVKHDLVTKPLAPSSRVNFLKCKSGHGIPVLSKTHTHT